MAKVTINKEKCKGCKLCISVCPKKIVVMSNKLNSKGFFSISIEEQNNCIGCGFCAIICPDSVIEIEK